MIRTKIVATLGPATASVDTLVRLIEEGMDVCRLNFSHGELSGHAQMLDLVRQAAAKAGEHVAVLGDLCGPKIRLGKVADIGGSGGMPIDVGDILIIQRQPIVGEDGRVSSNYAGLIDDVNVGDRIYIEDGLLRFVITEKTYSQITCACTAGGVLKSGKGINLPNTVVSIPSITDKDWQCAEWAIENGLSYLALSFVRKADDVLLLREHLRNKQSDINIISKIEKAEALSEIDGILEASDGLMVARGDLGVEMDVAQVPIIQKDLIRRCQMAGKPVIVATQMLQSMIEQSSPTRAEVSDVANAIFDGTDAVMLSGETSVGKYPIATVHMMAHIAEETERYQIRADGEVRPQVTSKTMQLSGAVARGVWQIVRDLRASLVCVWSQTGATARIFSKYRYPVPIVAFSSNDRVLRQMALQFGVIPQMMSPPDDMHTMIEQIDKLVLEKKLANYSERIVIVAGSALGTPGTMDGIVIHTVGQVAQRRVGVGELGMQNVEGAI